MLPMCMSSETERHCTRQRGVHTVEERMLSQRAQQQIPLRLSNYDPGFNSEAVFIQRHREAKRRRYSTRTNGGRQFTRLFLDPAPKYCGNRIAPTDTHSTAAPSQSVGWRSKAPQSRWNKTPGARQRSPLTLIWRRKS